MPPPNTRQPSIEDTPMTSNTLSNHQQHIGNTPHHKNQREQNGHNNGAQPLVLPRSNKEVLARQRYEAHKEIFTF